MRTMLAALATLLLANSLPAQDSRPEQPGDPQQQLPPDAANHPGVILGQRTAAILNARTVNPILVIVDSPDDYIDALALWSRQSFFPILIDDGTDHAAHDIARFARAFEPEQIVRWSPDEPLQGSLPERIERAQAKAWGVENLKALLDLLREGGTSPGAIAIASEQHAPWTAAAALACARALPIAWIDDRPGNPNGVMSPERARAIADAASARADELGLSWNTLRDDIDALAICLRIPGRIRDASGDNESLRALTDLAGRKDNGARWAYASWIFADEASAAYQAMASLFIIPDSAFLFDGYAPDFAPPYTLANTSNALQQSGWSVSFTPGGAGDPRIWRSRTSNGIDAAFIHVNSAGRSDWFNLNNQRTYASEIPSLLQPALVSFIHSFSAQAPANDRTIASHFLRNGAFAYIGAMHEPTLGAFLPLDILFARFAIAMPLAAAARQDNAPPWRIQLIGDPLYVMTVPRNRMTEPDIPQGARSLDDILVDQLSDKQLAAGARTLAMLARDDDLIRLARSTLADFTRNPDTTTISPDQMTAIARIALPTVARTEDPDLFANLYLVLERDTAERSDLRDLLWRALRPSLEATEPDPLHIALLRAHVRDATMPNDAADLRPAIERVHGRAAVVDLYSRLIDRAPNDRVRRQLTEDSPR